MRRVESVLVFLMNTGEIRTELGLWREQWGLEKRFAVAISDATARPIANNRNQAVLRFLQSGYGWMLMVDSDTVPSRNPLDLIEQNLDIVIFPTPMWRPGLVEHRPVVMNVNPLEGAEVQQNKLVEIGAGGAGCILIARRVLEHPDMRAPFVELLDEDGCTIHSEDIAFVRRAREAGFKVWAAMSHPCSHFRPVNLLQVHDEILRAVAAAKGA